MAKELIDAVAAGHICIDLIPGFDTTRKYSSGTIIQPGQLTFIQGAAASTGGSVSNTGLPLLKLGADVRLMGKVGDDFFGRAILDVLHRHGAGEGMAVVKGERSSYTVVIAPPGLDRSFLHDPGANSTFSYKDVDFDLVGRARLFHFGYPSLMDKLFANNGKELVRIFRKVKSLGATASLDMSFPDPNSPAGKADWKTILKATLPHVDIYLPNAEETMYMLDPKGFLKLKKKARDGDVLDLISADEISAAGARLIEMGAAVAGLKCGIKGLYLRTGPAEAFRRAGRAAPVDLKGWTNRELWMPSFKVKKLVNALGAGDCCVAGFLAGFLRGESIESCARVACAAGAHNVMASDATSGIKSWKETTAAIKKGWPTNALKLNGAGWSLDKKTGVWLGPCNE